MNKNRLEAFSDGVLALIIIIMVLEIKVPETANWADIKQLLPILIGCILSFAFIGVYWSLLESSFVASIKKVSSAIMWSNLNLLFLLSLLPFGTKWMRETHFDRFTVLAYSILLMICGLSFNILQNKIAHSLKKLDSIS